MIRKLTTMSILATSLIALPAFALQPPDTEEQKTLYALGLVVASQLDAFSLSPTELERVKEGITDKLTGQKVQVELSAYDEKVQELARIRWKAKGEKLAAGNKEFLEKAAAEKGAVKTDSGLVYVSLKEGEGSSPLATDTVKIHYRGTFIDGQEFGNSYKRNKTLDFPINTNGIIKCWSEGINKMKVGGKAKIVCPPALAYGETGYNAIYPNAILVFEVELVGILKPAVTPSPAMAPPNPGGK